ncbi:altronate dehydratase family protein [Acuticoccus sp. MNP-M23]|uniref:UxaA family hydrolase n=1 Tax=Acuticoccus sp. MNP-M23 TaxID=3072793 RepID=UPI002815C111|nr:altronate dehydratase family protein [Acuticoccus sp. MNP-M23]WMS44807.1 altronate dehydratase family protein [Acuticoccus sp. MNP-M23]
MQTNYVRLNEIDDVVTATRPLEAGTAVEAVATLSLVPRGHKIAVRAIAEGEPVRKYAQIIGYASKPIAAGEHVHDHNLAFRATDFDYQFGTNLREMPKPAGEDTFMGYRRESGKIGTRNYIGILTSVNCSATAAHKIAAHFTEEKLAAYPNVDGVVAFAHGTGCGMAGSGDGFAALQRTMWGYARHPNHAGVLMVGLGCEMNQIDWLLEAYGLKQGPLFATMNIQDVAGLRRTVDAGIKKIEAMLPLANQAKREPCPVSALTVALQCGGSDAWSGITANPALGHACDLLAAQGGIGLLAETPEIYGAEHLLAERAATPKVGEKLIARIKWWEDYVARNKGSMDNNPSPGNKRGGLSTILEKSLGAAAKGGTSPLTGVYEYAEEANTPGFGFMDSPGYDPASVTGQIASGSTVVVFTTGRGSAFGSKPSPTIKVATTSELYNKMNEDMDVDSGPILTGAETVESVGRQIYERIIAVASGEQSKSESQGLGDHEFVPWQIGAVM